MYALVSPWPPQRNGIADYAREVARHTAHPLQIVTECLRPAGGIEGLRFIDEAAFARAPHRLPAVYHFGNNPDHAFMLPLFLRDPGVAVVHDLSLQYLAEQADPLLPGFFAAELRREWPGLGERLAALWAKPGLKRGIDFQEVKLLGWLRHARAIVVHSHHAARIVAGYVPGQVPVHVLPHFAYLPGLSYPEIKELRERRRPALAGGNDRAARDRLYVTALGFPSQPKQYAAVLHAIATLPQPLRERVTFVIGGEVRPREYDLAADIARFGMAGQVELRGYLSPEEMEDLLIASDLIVTLRYPTFGESSGVLARALGWGCGILVTDNGSYAELPDEVCFKMPARPDSSAALRGLLTELLDNRWRLEQRRAAAYAYAHTTCNPERIAARYSAIADAG